MSVFVVSNCNLPEKDWEVISSSWSKTDTIAAIAVVRGKRVQLIRIQVIKDITIMRL